MQNTGKNFYLLKYALISMILFLCVFPCRLFAANADALYRDGKFDEAEKKYQQMDMDNPEDIRFRYNKGCAAFQKGDFKTAEAAFSSVLRRAKDKDVLFKSAYNLGNTAYSQNDFSSAAEFYKQAIVHNPDSKDAKFNLELSLKKLDDQKKNKDQDKDKKDKKDNKKDDKENKSSDKNNKDKKDEKNKDNNQKGNDRNQSGNMNEDQKKEDYKASLDKQKADALLDNIKENRAKVLEYQIPKDKKEPESGKNW